MNSATLLEQYLGFVLSMKSSQLLFSNLHSNKTLTHANHTSMFQITSSAELKWIEGSLDLRFCGFTMGPLSKMAVNYNAGCKTAMANVVQAIVMAHTTIFSLTIGRHFFMFSNLSVDIVHKVVLCSGATGLDITIIPFSISLLIFLNTPLVCFSFVNGFWNIAELENIVLC
ncbi:Sulfate transporter 3.1 [Spatholobus suberectus]|nr:Sulfate transporter 3.1 [Spatholobus suberectus]